MAGADYRLCDVCEGKVFYDSSLNYESTKDPGDTVRNAGKLMTHCQLDYLGDWVVICIDCAKTHKCVVVPIEGFAP